MKRKRKIKKIIPMMREPESEYQYSKDMISSISLERLAIALISFMFGLFVGFILVIVLTRGGA